MTKAELRRELRAARRRFVAEIGARRGELEAAIGARLRHLTVGFDRLAIYWAIGAEVGVCETLTSLPSGACLALPCVADHMSILQFRSWQPGEPLITGSLGFPEPSADAAELTPDLIVTPLVGFSRGGARLGQGGGFYDRAFAAYPHARRIGVGWSVQEAASIPLDPWDVPLHAIVTEREVIEVAL